MLVAMATKRSAAQIARAMMAGKPAKPAAKQPAPKQPAAKKAAPKTPAAKQAAATPDLAGVERAVAAGDLAAALTAALAVFARFPDPRLADLIATLGERAAATIPAPTGATPKLRNAAYDAMAKAGDPVARHHLIVDLANTKGNGDTLARLELLLAHGALGDPRLAHKLADFVEVPLYNASVSRTNAFWKRVFALLPTLGDPRILARARAWRERWAKNRQLNPAEREQLDRRLAKIDDALVAAYGAPAALPAADVARLGALAAAVATGGRAEAADEDALLAAVHAAPDDDAPRAVYGDWLQQQPDAARRARGELIALQLAGTPDDDARVKKLIREHAHRWLGDHARYLVPAGEVDDDVAFVRGFLARARIVRAGDDRVPGAPMWATLEEVRGVVPVAPDHPLPALRRALDLDRGALEQLADAPAGTPRLEHLAYTAGKTDAAADERAAATAFARASLPALRRLELWGNEAWLTAARGPDALAAWGWDRRALVELAITAHATQLAAWLGVVAPTAITRFALMTATNGWRTGGWTIALTRTDRRAPWSALDLALPFWYAPAESTPIVEALAALPANSLAVTTTRLVGNKAVSRALETALARLRRDERA